MRLYVWEDALEDYTPGIMFAFAKNANEARKMILEKYPNSTSVNRDLKQKPKSYSKPVGFAVWGGS